MRKDSGGDQRLSSEAGKTFTVRSESPFGHASDENKHNETL